MRLQIMYRDVNSSMYTVQWHSSDERSVSISFKMVIFIGSEIHWSGCVMQTNTYRIPNLFHIHWKKKNENYF